MVGPFKGLEKEKEELHQKSKNLEQEKDGIINELKVFEQKLNNQDSGNHELLNKIDLIEKENQTIKDELIKKFFSVEFTRFFNYYQKTKNLNVQ